MKEILISTRVAINADYAERRDALDQRWFPFLLKLGLLARILPNHLPTVQLICEQHQAKGILLTGGNTPVLCGGDAPERDAVDTWLIDWAVQHQLPLLGVCRGMQSLLIWSGSPLLSCPDQVQMEQALETQRGPSYIQSYHSWGAEQINGDWDVWAKSGRWIKAIRHIHNPLWGIMWHPEREAHPEDRVLFQEVFACGH